jgi:hypothetical protein
MNQHFCCCLGCDHAPSLLLGLSISVLVSHKPRTSITIDRLCAALACLQVPDLESPSELETLAHACVRKAAKRKHTVEELNAEAGMTELAQSLISSQTMLVDYCACPDSQDKIKQTIAGVHNEAAINRPASLKQIGNRLFQAGDMHGAVIHWRAAVRLQCKRGDEAVARLLTCRTEVWSEVCLAACGGRVSYILRHLHSYTKQMNQLTRMHLVI